MVVSVLLSFSRGCISIPDISRLLAHKWLRCYIKQHPLKKMYVCVEWMNVRVSVTVTETSHQTLFKSNESIYRYIESVPKKEEKKRKKKTILSKRICGAVNEIAFNRCTMFNQNAIETIFSFFFSLSSSLIHWVRFVDF